MSAGFPPYILRSVLRAHFRTSRRNYSSRDYSSHILSNASPYPKRERPLVTSKLGTNQRGADSRARRSRESQNRKCWLELKNFEDNSGASVGRCARNGSAHLPIPSREGSGSFRCGEAFRSACKSPAPHRVTYALCRDHLGRRDPLASLRRNDVSQPARDGGEGSRPVAAQSESGLQRPPTDVPLPRRYLRPYSW
jgi:hypothetical protein